jgi:hypothetical protein
MISSMSKIKIKIRFEDRIGLVLRQKAKGNTYSDGPNRKIYSPTLGLEVQNSFFWDRGPILSPKRYVLLFLSMGRWAKHKECQ